MTTNEDGSISFTLSKEQWNKYLKWRENLPKLESGHFGAIGGGMIFEFIPTGLGMIEKVRRDDKKEHVLDLTIFDNW